MVTIAIDAMGGDHGPRVTVPAALSALEAHSDLNILLYGNRAKLDHYLNDSTASTRLKIIHTDEAVSSGERSSGALRKKQSSMRLAVDSVKNEEADALVSAGNTGALVAISRYVLKTMLGIDRPALIARLPNVYGFSYMLDLGANVECDSENLHQFAVMGSAYASAIGEIQTPKVALLNIGSEEIKGNEDIRLANAILKDSECLNYVGYVEGDDLYKGIADVIVTNGFAGNIALKSSEGLLSFTTHMVRKAFKKNIFTRVIGLFALPVLDSLRLASEPDLKSGGVLLGVQGIVVKSHGKSQKCAFENAIDGAYRLAKNKLLQQIAEMLDDEML
ncbi:phosphate acyltransferase PlsX [Oceaniserpentilla sp. 4NH20-0058]|uniref:phosphate acyltransferase PlsX n=1 Tax=Oceaniserpentilla sp. 4NH20-0058 TaxID=3127660 RepID=UPI00310B623C